MFLPGGSASAAALQRIGDAVHFVEEAYRHFKATAANAEGQAVLTTAVGNVGSQPGVVVGATGGAVANPFVQAPAQHRHWTRQGTDQVSA